MVLPLHQLAHQRITLHVTQTTQYLWPPSTLKAEIQCVASRGPKLISQKTSVQSEQHFLRYGKICVEKHTFSKKFLNYVALGGGMMLNPWQNLAARNESQSRPSSVPHGGEKGKARVVKGRGKKRKYEDSTAQAPSLGAIHLVRTQIFRLFRPPPPLVRILARFVRLNSRNLPYYVRFWAPSPPPPRCVRT